MTILQKIEEVKREEVNQLLPSWADLAARSKDSSPPRGFQDKLADSPHPVSLIAEVKKASPSRGLIRPDFDPAAIASSYARAGADCLSVLTDRQFFQGSPDYLPLCRSESGLPCLRKDFIIHPVQVLEARVLQADAILLILAMLSPHQADELGQLAQSLGMDVLVEVHDEEEAARVPEWASLVGVNNRSLHTFAEDLSVTARLASLLQRPGRLFVSESSLSRPEDIHQAKEAGARSVLIGTAFCSSPDIEAKVKEVMGW